jgi:sarcosine/dimethylglycine N-methyltransferase
MKDMKLYDQVDRIHAELTALGIDRGAPLTIEQLAPFDQFHYCGNQATDQAIAALGLRRGMRVLDIGAGLGGPARYIAARTGAMVTALELQADLNQEAADLTARCGLAERVAHRQGNILDGIEGQFDAIISFLCFLHIGERPRLLSICRSLLVDGGGLYIEDYARRREPTAAEIHALALKVQCPGVPTPDAYIGQLRGAGFTGIAYEDATVEWTGFTRNRLHDFHKARVRQEALHGPQFVEGLADFYATIVDLFESGLIVGMKIQARR